MTLRPVGFAAARVALHRSARSRVTSFRERERIPSLFGGGVWCVSFGVVSFFSSYELSRDSPFIASKVRARVTFVVKR
jgi:hypothetical protein